MKKSVLYRIRRKLQVCFFNLTSAKTVSKFYFKLLMKYKLNLDDPKTFNEKIQWLKLYNWPTNKLVIQCTDKYSVRKYLIEQKCDNYLNTLIGVYDNPSEINFEQLPKQFVLKCTHGCAYNIICKDKSLLNVDKVKKQLKKWLKEDFGKFNGEIHYSKIKPRIICETYLGDDLQDFKLFCFNGKFQFMYIAVDSENDSQIERELFFDRDGKVIDVLNADYGRFDEAKLPANLDDLIRISELLAKPFPFVRVDWYIRNEQTIFGELTFTPSGGLMRFNPSKYDKIFGKYLDISALVEENNGKR